MQLADLGLAREMQQQALPDRPCCGGIVVCAPFGSDYFMAPEMRRASVQQPQWVSGNQ